MKRFITIVLLLLATSIARASDPAMVIHLLNYLAKDYGGAVQNGKIVSQSEYQEQVEFAEIIEKETAQIPTLNSDSQFKDGIKNLIRVIKSKGDPKDVEKIARSLQASAIQLSKFKVAPTKFPDLSHGEKLYQTNCVACHGMRGQGDGPAGVALDPKPANFTDPETMKISSPFQYFTTVRLGVPGTGMAAFSTLTDEDVWALAFYIKTLGFQAVEKTQNGLISNLDLAQLATKTDQEIFDSLQGSDEEKNTTL